VRVYLFNFLSRAQLIGSAACLDSLAARLVVSPAFGEPAQGNRSLLLLDCDNKGNADCLPNRVQFSVGNIKPTARLMRGL